MVYAIHFPLARENLQLLLGLCLKPGEWFDQSNVFVAHNTLYKPDGNLSGSSVLLGHEPKPIRVTKMAALWFNQLWMKLLRNSFFGMKFSFSAALVHSKL